MSIELNQKALSKIADHRKAADRMEAKWEASKALLLPVMEKFVTLGSEPYLYNDNFVYASLTGDVTTLTSAIRALRTGGFKSTEKPERKSSEFTASFTHPDSQLLILLAFSSSVCRRVKVGTKTETVDVYEIHCGESEDFAAEPGDLSETPF